MKTQAMKITALVLCAVLIFGVAGTAVHALAAGGAGQEVEAKTAEAVAPADGGEALDGTVYVLTGADGAVRKTIYGNDAPGQETGELPVELAVTYRLDGGIGQLSAGAQSLKKGIGTLDSGAAEAQAGAGELSAGLDALAASSGALNGGAAQVFETLLSTASTQLSAAGVPVPAMTISNYAEVLDGVIASLDETAVYEQALVEAVDGDLEGLIERIRGTVEVSRNYRWLPASQGEAAGQVKFIYRTDPIKAD